MEKVLAYIRFDGYETPEDFLNSVIRNPEYGYVEETVQNHSDSKNGREDDKSEDNTISKKADYILPDSSDRILTEKDLSGLSADELKKARNEITARHGRKFDDNELQKYFDSKSWYKGTIEPDDFDIYEMLSETERKNMFFIKDHE